MRGHNLFLYRINKNCHQILPLIYSSAFLSLIGGKNSEKEKEKLANFMAFGTDLPPPSEQKRKPREYVEPEDVPDVDRFAECKLNYLKKKKNWNT